MARRKNENIRKLQNPANRSYTVSIPISMIRELKWKKHQKVVVKLQGKKIMIEDWKK